MRIGDRTTTKPVERLGSIEEIKSRCGDQDPIEWAREYTKKLTLAEKEAKKGVLLKLSSSMLIDKNIRFTILWDWIRPADLSLKNTSLIMISMTFFPCLFIPELLHLLPSFLL